MLDKLAHHSKVHIDHEQGSPGIDGMRVEQLPG
jgi:hypothetical protein